MWERKVHISHRWSTLAAPTELVRLRFQQSGLILFCSSARALAWTVNTRRSSLRIFFHRSPRRTLMALGMNTWSKLRQLVWSWVIANMLNTLNDWRLARGSKATRTHSCTHTHNFLMYCLISFFYWLHWCTFLQISKRLLTEIVDAHSRCIMYGIASIPSDSSHFYTNNESFCVNRHWHFTNPPVVFARVHLRVFHTEFLGKQHEGVHWPLAFGGSGTAAPCWQFCAMALGFGRFTRRSGIVPVCRD